MLMLKDLYEVIRACLRGGMLEEVTERMRLLVDLCAAPGQPEAPSPSPVLGTSVCLPFFALRAAPRTGS